MRFYTSILLLLVFKANSAFAMNLDWSGGYRFEWTQVDRPSLGVPSERKAYGLNYLYLSPKIVAADGFNIVSRFDILGSDETAYRNSQVGQIWGAGSTTTAATDGSQRNVNRKTQSSSSVQVSQLYLHGVQEYGSLLVGRAPLQFGLGISYNSGAGLFDHWYNNRDLVAYKFIIGNFYFMPMIGRVYDADYWQGNSIQDEIIEFGYEAPDSGSLLGVILEKRKGSLGVNDVDATRYLQAPLSGSVNGDYSSQRTNFVLGKRWSTFGFKIEGSFLQGDTGIQTTTGEFVKENSYGIASEWYYTPAESKWDLTLRAGMATGDDPGTADYEGFQYDRNYDVAFLLFNHRLGRKDFLTTNLIKDQSAGRGLHNSVDDEAIGNAMYFSPKVKYLWSDKLDLNNSLTYAQLMTNPTNAREFKKDLGWEWDIELVYKAREKVQWVNQLGILIPGDAFENGVDKYSTDTIYGFASKIAISF